MGRRVRARRVRAIRLAVYYKFNYVVLDTGFFDEQFPGTTVTP